MENIALKVLLYAPPLLLAVILHEIAHGAVAYKLGDPTAKEQGRLTLNPIKHIDPFMTILLPALLIFAGSPVVFGGAKPVPVNPMYFKNSRRGMLWVALAGPCTNILLALISIVLYKNYATALQQTDGFLANILHGWILVSIVINIVLAIFNLFPVLPLDGGRILSGILPAKIARFMAKFERYGLAIIFLLLFTGVFQSVLSPVMHTIENILQNSTEKF